MSAFEPGAWLADVRTRLLPLADQGAWAALLATALVRGEQGRLRLSWAELGRLLGLPEGEAREVVWRLVCGGVCEGSLDDHGCTITAKPAKPATVVVG